MAIVKMRATQIVVGDQVWNGNTGLEVTKIERDVIDGKWRLDGVPMDVVWITMSPPNPLRFWFPLDHEIEVVERD